MGPYLAQLNTPPDEHQQRLLDVAGSMRSGGMTLSHEAAVFLSILVGAIRPRFAVEIGTFVGYSSLAIARALPPGGTLLCCDVSDEWTSIARQYWDAAGVGDKVELRLGPAAETISSLPADPAIDFAFIDADKAGYLGYYHELLGRLSPHGVIAVDNTMWGGRVIDEGDTSDNTAALRHFNQQVSADERTVNVTLPLGDGITLISRAR
jgi:caffeoyl-CoA O-methyltransferase